MPESAEDLTMTCFHLSKAVEEMPFASDAAAPLVRRLLRVAGRVIIDMAGPDADPSTWGGTEEMALLWLDEALKPLGYCVKPLDGSGRPELPDPAGDWH